MAEHEELVLAVGPYLLGALDPATRREVRDHLDDCDVCQAELIRLAAVPGFLSHAAPRQVDPDVEPPSALRERLVTQVLAERTASKRRVQLATAAALLLLFLPAGVFFALRVGRSAAEQPQVVATETALQFVAMTPASEEISLRGEVAWTRHEWGVEFNLVTWNGVPNQRLSLIAVSQDGRREQAAAWEFIGGRIPSTGTTSIKEQEMARVLVENAEGEQLLVLELTNA
jgi:putative zinc finger protein